MKYITIFYDKTKGKIISVAIRQTPDGAHDFAVGFASTIEQEIPDYPPGQTIILSNELYHAEIKVYESNIEADNLFFNGTELVNDPVNGEFIYLV